MLEAPGRFPANILGMGALSAVLTREGESRQVISKLTNEAAVANQPPFILQGEEPTAHRQDPAGGTAI